MRSNRPSAGDADQGRCRRILHVTFGLDVGGQEKLLVEFARHSDPERFDLRFVSLGSRGRAGRGHRGVGLAGDRDWAAASGLRPSLIVDLARFFRRWRPDVVHTHDQRALFYAGPAAWATRVPRLIHTRHGRNFHSTPRQITIGRQLARLVDRYVCVSDDVKAQCVAEGIARSRLLTIKNGIDLERFAFSGSCPGGPIVAVARLSPEKDVANLIRAAAIVRRSDPDLRIEVAGDGQCLPELRRLVAELGLEGQVLLLGEVGDVAGLLARGRLFVLPSRSEGISLTLLEAMACGLPVVATRVGGTPEVVVDGETGLLVPPGDPAALADAILRSAARPRGGAAHGRGRPAARRADLRRPPDGRRVRGALCRCGDARMPGDLFGSSGYQGSPGRSRPTGRGVVRHGAVVECRHRRLGAALPT